MGNAQGNCQWACSRAAYLARRRPLRWICDFDVCAFAAISLTRGVCWRDAVEWLWWWCRRGIGQDAVLPGTGSGTVEARIRWVGDGNRSVFALLAWRAGIRNAAAARRLHCTHARKSRRIRWKSGVDSAARNRRRAAVTTPGKTILDSRLPA